MWETRSRSSPSVSQSIDRSRNQSRCLVRAGRALIDSASQGLSATTIKKLCRKLGINKWPYKSPFRTPRGASSAPPGAKASGSSKHSSVAIESNDNTDDDDVSNSDRSTPSPSSSLPLGPKEHEGEERMLITSLLSNASPVDAVQPITKRAKIAA